MCNRQSCIKQLVTKIKLIELNKPANYGARITVFDLYKQLSAENKNSENELQI